MSSDVIIGIGANINPEQNILMALKLLSKKVKIKNISPFYRSSPADGQDQLDFINGVCVINTDISPRDLKYKILRKIESKLGRIRTQDKNASRPIDLDILLYGNRVIIENDLIIPDPQITEYPFIYIPLLDIRPHVVIPSRNTKLKNLVNIIDSCQILYKMVKFSKKLRERYIL